MGRRAGSLGLLVALAAGCDGVVDAALARVGVAHYRVVEGVEARSLVETREALLLQVRGEERTRTLAPGARLVRAGDALSLPEDGRPVVVVAEDPLLGARLASRLARDGVRRVHVTSDGLASWAAPGADLMQPPAPDGIGAEDGT